MADTRFGRSSLPPMAQPDTAILVLSATATAADATPMVMKGGDTPPSLPGAQGMLLGTNSPASTPCPQREHSQSQLSTQLAQQKACLGAGHPPPHTHTGLKGFSTDNIAHLSEPLPPRH